MIVQLRIDDRLIHEQIVTQWSRALDINAIVVANDKSAKDALTKQMLIMAGSSTGKKVRICTVEGAIQLLSDPRAAAMKVLLIADSPEDAYRLVEALKIQEVNVCNYLQKITEGQIQVTGFCRTNRKQFEQFEKLAEITPKIYNKMLPDDTPLDFREALKRARQKF